jgi:hypothetical protein
MFSDMMFSHARGPRQDNEEEEDRDAMEAAILFFLCRLLRKREKRALVCAGRGA